MLHFLFFLLNFLRHATCHPATLLLYRKDYFFINLLGVFVLLWLKKPATSVWVVDLVLPATGESLGVSFFPTALTTGVLGKPPPDTLPSTVLFKGRVIVCLFSVFLLLLLSLLLLEHHYVIDFLEY